MRVARHGIGSVLKDGPSRIGLVADPLLKGHDDVLTVFLSTSNGQTGEEFPPEASD